MAAYKENQIEIWKSAIEERHNANVSRTRLVHNAQRALALGMLVVAIGLAMLGYSVRNAVPSKQERRMPDPKTQTPKPASHPYQKVTPAAERAALESPLRANILETLRSREFIRRQVAKLERTF